MNRERIKTLVLTTLVVSSILLTQQLWFPKPIQSFFSKSTSSQEIDAMALEKQKDYIAPKNIMISFGAADRKQNLFTILSSDIEKFWDESKDLLRPYFLGEPEISIVGQETYIEANTLKSVELEFASGTPTILLSLIFDSLDNQMVKQIQSIHKILLPALNKGSIYIVDQDQNFYQVKLSPYQENSNLVKFIDDHAMTNYIRYHSLFSLFDDSEGNYTPMPINYDVDSTQIYVKSQVNLQDDGSIIDKSKKFFNENFDFVKKIKESSGAVVYVYGYGEKSVRINNNGTLEYNEEIGNISSTDIVASFNAATNFMYAKGDALEGIYLKEIQPIRTGYNEGYLLGFGYRIMGYPVEFNIDEMNHLIEVEVYGNKVKSYRTLIRDVVDFKESFYESKPLHFPDVIQNNIETLKQEFFKVDLNNVMDESERMQKIYENIEEVRLVYFDGLEDSQNQQLELSWRIKIKNNIYYFDIYTGALKSKRILPVS